MNNFRSRAVSKSTLVGTFAEIPHPVAIEVTAQAKPDFICIDWEHGQIARDQIENLVRASDIHRVPAMVRVPGHAPEEIAAALDSGAQGILAPRVSTAAQAAAIVKASPTSTGSRRRRALTSSSSDPATSPSRSTRTALKARKNSPRRSARSLPRR